MRYKYTVPPIKAGDDILSSVYVVVPCASIREEIARIELFILGVVGRVPGELLGALAGDTPVPCFRLRVDKIFRGVPCPRVKRALDDVMTEPGEAALCELQAAGVRIAEPPKVFELVSIHSAG